MVDDPIEITSVTPYDRSGRARADLPITAVGFGWPAVAVLAVAASFVRVYSISTTISGGDGEASGLAGYAVDGWGRLSTVHTASETFEVSGVSGPRYGVLYCVAAGVILLGWLLGLLAMRSGRRPAGRAVTGAGCAFLAGVVACEVVATLPSRNGLPQADIAFAFGPSPWLAGSACVLGSVTWAAQWRAQRSTFAADCDLAAR